MYRAAVEALRFEEKDSLLFKTDPRAKLAISIAYAIVAALINNLLIQTVLTVYLILYLTILGKIARKVGKNLMLITPLAIIVFIANYIVTYNLVGSIVPAQKLINLVLSFNLFFLTTSPDDFSLTLEKLGLPLTVTLALSLSLRFVYVLAKVLQEIVEAQLARGHRLDTGGFLQRIKNYIPILIPLIIISIRKSMIVAETLELRGFHEGSKRTTMEELRITWADIALLIASLLTAATFLLASITLDIEKLLML